MSKASEAMAEFDTHFTSWFVAKLANIAERMNATATNGDGVGYCLAVCELGQLGMLMESFSEPSLEVAKARPGLAVKAQQAVIDLAKEYTELYNKQRKEILGASPDTDAVLVPEGSISLGAGKVPLLN